MEKTKVVIADGHELIREGLVARLRKDLDVDVIAEASDGYSALKFCRQYSPEVLIMDLSLTRPSGLDTLARATKEHNNMKVIVLSSEASISNAMFVLSHGAVGFMPRQSRGSDFVNAVRAAQSGFAYLPNELLVALVSARRNVTRSGNVYGLSPRELEILEACLADFSTKEIAQRLKISPRTVETHRNSIHRKTACKSYQELAHLVELDRASS